MEGGSTASPPFDASNPTAGSSGGASKFLANLPSRGLLSSTILSSNPGGMRVYICDHDTSPPGDMHSRNFINCIPALLYYCIELFCLVMNLFLGAVYNGRSQLDSVVSEDQLIRTNQTNILIRSLMLKNLKGDTKDGKGTSSNQGSRKRAAEKALDKAAGKKAMSSTQLGASQEAASRVLDKDLQSLTVERLRALLKERGLSVKGKKASTHHLLICWINLSENGIDQDLL
ncbi:UNVERIFIED_CONTAM: hypothetical protein Sradi_3957700 [Sesamum radiatum]|uniref:SAP domain-containing protein n=2 Tax=Sesamum TaxID=4181 RepID=A0AAW2PHC4_SESRA